MAIPCFCISTTRPAAASTTPPSLSVAIFHRHLTRKDVEQLRGCVMWLFEQHGTAWHFLAQHQLPPHSLLQHMHIPWAAMASCGSDQFSVVFYGICPDLIIVPSYYTWDAAAALCCYTLLGHTRTISMAVTLKGRPATGLCPGETYDITVTFPQPRAALVTVSQGTILQSDVPRWWALQQL